MMIIDEKEFNKLWTVARYVYGLFPIINVIVAIPISYILMRPFIEAHELIKNQLYLLLIAWIISFALGVLILTRSPRWGAYLMALYYSFFFLYSILGPLYNYYLTSSFLPFNLDISSFIIMFGYLLFGLLTKLKETARQE